MSSIGERIKTLRQARGLSQAELARRIGVKQPSLWEIERDITKNIKSTTLDALCSELGTTSGFLLRGGDNESSDSIQLATMEAELLFVLRSLPPDKRIALMEYARFLRTGAPAQPAPAKIPAQVQALKKK